MQLPPMQLSGQSASESKQSSGDVFNFAPPTAKTNTVLIYGIAAAAALGVAYFAFKGR